MISSKPHTLSSLRTVITPESGLKGLLLLVQRLISSCSLKHQGTLHLLWEESVCSVHLQVNLCLFALSYTSPESMTNSVISGLLLILVTVPQLKTSSSSHLQCLGFIWLRLQHTYSKGALALPSGPVFSDSPSSSVVRRVRHEQCNPSKPWTVKTQSFRGEFIVWEHIQYFLSIIYENNKK